MTKIKICGIRDRATLAHCAALNVDWIGYVFFAQSPRFVSSAAVMKIDDAAPPARDGGPQRVGLFVRPDDVFLRTTLRETALDALQIYDDEPGRIDIIRRMSGLPVWQALGIRSGAELPDRTSADGLVIEAPPASGDNRPGGLGKRFDWTLTAKWTAPTPWMLAGGLTPDNVRAALSQSRAPAVDVSSGVEQDRGIKSLDLIEKFVRNTRKRGCVREAG